MKSGASSLSAFGRLALGAQIAGGQSSISGASRVYDVSRKFARIQRDEAVRIMEEDARRRRTPAVVVVDESFMERFIVAAALICNCPFRGIMELSKTMFEYAPSLGTIHNVCRKAIDRAKEINSTEKLGDIRHVALDEIFQKSTPVFAGVDLASLYVFLLHVEQERSGTAWWYELDQCKELGLSPLSAIGDGGQGLRKGMAECFPGVPCDSDVFHALKDITQTLGYLEKKALGSIGKEEELLDARKKLVGLRKNGVSRRLGEVRKQEAKLLQCHSTVETIYEFLQKDVLDFNEIPFEDRRRLFEWLIGELAAVEDVYGRIPPLRKKLEKQEETLLAVFRRLDQAVIRLSGKYGMDIADARMMVNMFNGHGDDFRTEEALSCMIEKYGLESMQAYLDDLYELMHESFRASSAVENMNSILRTYFQQRREIGHDYLELLRFYLNHRSVDRSRVSERVGKSPYELLTGKKHGHWLDMLGFPLKAA